MLQIQKYPPPKSGRTRTYNVHVGEQYFRIEVDPTEDDDASFQESNDGITITDNEIKDSANITTIKAPMPGLVSRYIVSVGESVQAGDTLVILEAMKMENSLPAPEAGVVRDLPVKVGTTVKKGDILAEISLE